MHRHRSAQHAGADRSAMDGGCDGRARSKFHAEVECRSDESSVRKEGRSPPITLFNWHCKARSAAYAAPFLGTHLVCRLTHVFYTQVVTPIIAIKLPAALEKFVASQVREGRYRRREAAIIAAVLHQKRR